jgi:hypothetical protein
MSRTTPFKLTVRTPTRRNTDVLDSLKSGIRMRSKTWSKSGRFASPSDDRRASKRSLREGRDA